MTGRDLAAAWPKEFNAKAVKLIRERSGGVCEGCGIERATQIHHRKYKSRGGRGNPANGLHVCGFGNAGGCHGIAHTAIGQERGWSLGSYFVPAGEPVMHAAHGPVLFDDLGGYEITTGKGWAY
jgi:hypothetical protein